MWAQSGSGAGTHRPSSVSVQSSGGKGAGARKAINAQEETDILSAYRTQRRGGMLPPNPAYRQYMKADKAAVSSSREDAAKLKAYREGRRGKPLDPAYKQYAKAQSDTTAMPKRIMAPNNQKTGAQVLRQKAGLKKDITSGFVPSIGVKQGKQRDLQSPAKNLYPPAGSKKK